ncbi:MAG: deoxyribonuclease V [Pirellulales bacterium]|nr:deoxyribonuclease V [Pirellulales bacterium]
MADNWPPPAPHRWDVTPREARQIQEQIRSRVSQRNGPKLKRLRYVAGVDCAMRNERAVAAVPVLEFDSMETVDLAVVELPIAFPYVPGLLTFRECPAILAAMAMLKVRPDLVMVDGQGFAHPRRIGIASHLGVLLDTPTIGCAKSRLIGAHDEPYHEAGYYADLWDKDELIGGVLRTRTHVRPLYISIGHKVDLPTALNLTLECCRGFRLPEPTRRAHQAAGGTLLQALWPASVSKPQRNVDARDSVV